MSEMNHERFEDLKDTYVLGALPEEERRSFEDYLAAHPERQAEIDELSAVAGLLAFSPQEHEPSPELHRRIMEVVEAEAAPRAAPRRSVFARFSEYLDARSLALGAAVLLVVGLLSWNVLLHDQVNDLQGHVQSLQNQPEEPRMIALGGPGTKQGARAELVTLDTGRAVLVADNMPPAPDGKIYQIWVIKGGTPQPSGLFKPNGNSIVAVVKKPVKGADAVAVTVEPEGGSKEPTTDPMLVGKVNG